MGAVTGTVPSITLISDRQGILKAAPPASSSQLSPRLRGEEIKSLVTWKIQYSECVLHLQAYLEGATAMEKTEKKDAIQ